MARKSPAAALFSELQTIVREIATQATVDYLANLHPRAVQLSLPSGRVVDCGIQHRQFPRLCYLLNLGLNVWVRGPAGSGKTFAAEAAAEAFGLDYYFNGAIDTEYKVLGYTDANGRVVETPFRRAWTNGGLYLFDEIDASMPSAVLALNAALAGKYCDFPGESKPVRMHPAFRCIGAANTFGLGADASYVGRAKMDGAFLSRFVPLDWPYDSALENHIAGNDATTAAVRQVRDALLEHGISVVVTPRDSIAVAKMVSAGMHPIEALEQSVFSRMTQTDRETIGELPAVAALAEMDGGAEC